MTLFVAPAARSIGHDGFCGVNTCTGDVAPPRALLDTLIRLAAFSSTVLPPPSARPASSQYPHPLPSSAVFAGDRLLFCFPVLTHPLSSLLPLSHPTLLGSPIPSPPRPAFSPSSTRSWQLTTIGRPTCSIIFRLSWRKLWRFKYAYPSFESCFLEVSFSGGSDFRQDSRSARRSSSRFLVLHPQLGLRPIPRIPPAFLSSTLPFFRPPLLDYIPLLVYNPIVTLISDLPPPSHRLPVPRGPRFRARLSAASINAALHILPESTLARPSMPSACLPCLDLVLLSFTLLASGFKDINTRARRRLTPRDDLH
ncbi:hypothetical protein C8R45DRAFT_1211997 [Mycena sanguinolenta]|nr:hypothetical protein C8R45DRAFT_1211997 [Mycena sanguinolenta]